MGLASNTSYLLVTARSNEVPDHARVEYHMLSWRELYDKSIISADRYSSSAGQWVLLGDRHFYTVMVTTHPVYILPQELCLFFDCFTETKVSGNTTTMGPPIDKVANEFITLLSTFVREPLVPLGVRRNNDQPVVDRYRYPWPPRPNREPPPAAGLDSREFVSVLKGLAKAPQATIDAALAASRLYYDALASVAFDPSSAYVLLVSAIECLAGHLYENRIFDFKTVQKFESLVPLLFAVANLQGGKDLVADLEQELLRSEHFLFQKFALLIADHLPNEFWKTTDDLYPYSKVFPTIGEQDLKWCLREIYTARSKYVHTGTPFPAHVEFGLGAMVPADVSMDLICMLSNSPRRYFPPFSWFERVTHLVLVEFLRRSFAPELVQTKKADEAERERTLGVITGLPERVRKCLEKLTHWTARFLNYSVINPLATNKDWADDAETVKILLDAGLIGSKGDGLDGVSWLRNREVGEVIGEFFFGAANNPFRGNEILLTKNWDDIWGRASADE